MSPENAESRHAQPTVTAGAPGDVISTAPSSGGALEPLPVTEVPADVVEQAPTSTEYIDLVAERLSHYRNGSQYAETLADDPRLSPGQRERLTRRKMWATRLVPTLPRSVLAGVTTTTTMPFLDWWGLAVGITVGVGTGVAASRVIKNTPATQVTISTAAHLAVTDYRESLTALLATASDSRSYVSVSWFEARVDEALLAVTSPDVVGEDRRKVVDELCEIGARAWALAQLEARHAAVTETSVGAVAEALDEVPEGPDFSELDAVASKVAVDTAEFAEVMGVDLPDLTSPPRDSDVEQAGADDVVSCSHCGAMNVTLRGYTALCGTCSNYWTVPTPTSALYCTGTGDHGCACSSCQADEAIEKSWHGLDAMPSCEPCHQPVSEAATYHQRPLSIDDAAPGAIAAARDALQATGLDWSTDSVKRCQMCQGSGLSSYRGEGGKCSRCQGTSWQRGTAQFKAIMAMAEVQAHAILAAAEAEDSWEDAE